jgi:hypothetical protein
MMIENAPPADEPLPLANRKATLFGVTIPFLIVSWMAVIFRLWVRLRVVREPGWDDFFVLASAVRDPVSAVSYRYMLTLVASFAILQQRYLFAWVSNNHLDDLNKLTVFCSRQIWPRASYALHWYTKHQDVPPRTMIPGS